MSRSISSSSYRSYEKTDAEKLQEQTRLVELQIQAKKNELAAQQELLRKQQELAKLQSQLDNVNDQLNPKFGYIGFDNRK